MIRVGDCLETLRTLADCSVDAVVTDPPYGLGKEPKARDVLRAWLDGEEFKPGGAGFMGKSWDAFVPSPLVWAECLRVLKPAGASGSQKPSDAHRRQAGAAPDSNHESPAGE